MARKMKGEPLFEPRLWVGDRRRTLLLLVTLQLASIANFLLEWHDEMPESVRDLPECQRFAVLHYDIAHSQWECVLEGDETRYNLNGVYFEVDQGTGKIRMVATDGRDALAPTPPAQERGR